LAKGTGTALAVSPQAEGDLLVLTVSTSNGVPPTVSTVSGGGVSTWALAKRVTVTSNNDSDVEIWSGTVTSTGASSVGITVSGYSNVNDLTAQEFTAGAQVTWSVPGAGALTSAGSPWLYPSLAAGTGELYYGVATVNNSSTLSGGGTAGFKYVPTGLPQGDMVAYDAGVSGTVQPAGATSNSGSGEDAVGALFSATAVVTTTTVAPTTTTVAPTTTTVAPTTTTVAPTTTTVDPTTTTTAPSGGAGYTTVCGNPAYLQSPFTYAGSVPAGKLTSYSSGTTGLPTYGSAATTVTAAVGDVSTLAGSGTLSVASTSGFGPDASVMVAVSVSNAAGTSTVDALLTYTGTTATSFTGVSFVGGVGVGGAVAAGAAVTTDFPADTAGELVPAGDDASFWAANYNFAEGTVYWVAPGTHSFGTGVYGSTSLEAGNANDDAIVGGYSASAAQDAVINGSSDQAGAFEGNAPGVSIEYLEVDGYVPGNGSMVVNHDIASGWTVEYNYVHDNTQPGAPSSSPGGAGVGAGNDNVVEYNCLFHNGEYGFQIFGSGTTFDYNEVSENAYADHTLPTGDDCGCAGGGKIWDSTNVNFDFNYVHDNFNPGVWFDTDNTGAQVVGNYIARNWSEGMDYEISYNAVIEDNTFVDNDWGGGSNHQAGEPYGVALYIENSGGLGSPGATAGPAYGDQEPADTSAQPAGTAPDSRYQGELLVEGNTLTDNWGGIVVGMTNLRYCGTGNNTSTANCTLADPYAWSGDCPPGTADSSGSYGGGCGTCYQWYESASPSGPSPSWPELSAWSGVTDYFDACAYEARGVTVEANTFNFHPADIVGGSPGVFTDLELSNCYSGPDFLDVTADNPYYCGFNGLFVGGSAALPHDASLPGYDYTDAMMGYSTGGEAPFGDTWADNTYNGTQWGFDAYSQGTSPEPTDLCPSASSHAFCDGAGRANTLLGFSAWQSEWGQDTGSTQGS
jgi:hypothetical protein